MGDHVPMNVAGTENTMQSNARRIVMDTDLSSERVHEMSAAERPHLAQALHVPTITRPVASPFYSQEMNTGGSIPVVLSHAQTSMSVSSTSLPFTQQVHHHGVTNTNVVFGVPPANAVSTQASEDMIVQTEDAIAPPSPLHITMPHNPMGASPRTRRMLPDNPADLTSRKRLCVDGSEMEAIAAMLPLPKSDPASSMPSSMTYVTTEVDDIANRVAKIGEECRRQLAEMRRNYHNVTHVQDSRLTQLETRMGHMDQRVSQLQIMIKEMHLGMTMQMSVPGAAGSDLHVNEQMWKNQLARMQPRMLCVSDVVSINIGGRVRETTVKTLRNIQPNRLLDQVERNQSAKIFMDRCGDAFDYVLDFLRNPTKKVVVPPELHARFVDDLDFFGLTAEYQRIETVHDMLAQGHVFSSPLTPKTLYVVGGMNLSNSRGGLMRSVFGFNSVTKEWSALPALLPTTVYDAAAAVVHSQLYVLGGQHTIDSGATNTCYRFDNDFQMWLPISDMSGARYGHCAVTVGCYIYVVGGCHNNRALRTCERFNVVSGEWEAIASMYTPRRDACMCECDGRLYVMGGTANLQSPLDSVEVYDPATNTWYLAPPLPSAREGMGCACIDFTLFAIGGVDEEETPASTIFAFSPRVDAEWRRAGTMDWNTSPVDDMPDIARGYKLSFGGCCALGDQIYITGGFAGMEISRATMSFDPSTSAWTMLDSIPEPSERFAFTFT